MNRTRVPVTAAWGELVGYSRAIRVGDLIFVSGTAAADRDGNPLHPGDVTKQAEEIFRKIIAALEELGAGAQHVVETRVFLTDSRNWDLVGRVHASFFKDARPAITIVQVGPFLFPEMLVKIAVTASTA